MAKDLNKILSESAGLSGDIQEQITEAWDTKLVEAREEIAAQLREEFARKYEHDKGVLTETMDKFLTDKIRVELEEFAQDKNKLVQERIAYKGKVKEHANLLNKFITEQVSKEVIELRSDKVKMKEGFKKLENFMLKQLSEEIREFRKDKRELDEQRVKMVREGKQHLIETKKDFIKRASKIVESSINTALKTELTQFKDDIKIARENEFGRRIFESFVGEYLTSYLNEGTEVRKLQKDLEMKDKEIALVKESAASSSKIVESLQSNLNVMKDRLNRNKAMGELLSPLSREKRGLMKELLESVKTVDLEKAFNKYLPSVLNESVPTKASRTSVTESKLSERTGNRAVGNALQESIDNEFSDELAQIRTLAGLK